MLFTAVSRGQSWSAVTVMIAVLLVFAIDSMAQDRLVLQKDDNVIGCVDRGDSIFYTIRYENPNPYAIFDNFTIRDVVPAYADFVSATGGGVYSPATQSVRWQFASLDSAEVGYLGLVVEVAPTTPFGIVLVDSCLAFGDSVIADTTAVAESTVVCSPLYEPLLLSKDDRVATCVAYDFNVDYAIVYMNPNPYPASSVVVTDRLPETVDYMFATDGGIYDSGPHTVTWQLDSLAALVSDTVFVTVMVNASAVPGGSIIDSCMIISSETGATIAAETTAVCPASLEPLVLSKRDNVETCAELGGLVTYVLTYRNPNPVPVGLVEIQERLPFEMNFLSADGGGVYDPVTREVTWDIDTLAAGVIDSVTLRVEVDPGAPQDTAITDSAFIVWGDLDYSFATETTQICGPFLPLTLSKDDNLGGAPAVPGQLIEYTILYGNPNMLSGSDLNSLNGRPLLMRPDRPATNVILTDQIPDDTDFDYATSPGVFNPVTRQVTWTLGTLPSGASDSVNLGVRVMAATAPGTYVVNRCWITCDQTDPIYVEATETTLIVEAPIPTNMRIDIKPGGCPNPINPTSKGVIPAAILGSAELDVRSIDPTTISLTRGGVGEVVVPLRWAYEDVATPFAGEPCGCSARGRDGWLDMTLKFDTQDVIAALEFEHVLGQTIPLEITASLVDDTPMLGRDCVRVLDVGKSHGKNAPKGVGFVPSDAILCRAGSHVTISFYIENAGPVQLDIYDVCGQSIRRLRDQVMDPGMHAMSWDQNDNSGVRVESGVYFARLRSGTFAATTKILLVN